MRPQTGVEKDLGGKQEGEDCLEQFDVGGGRTIKRLEEEGIRVNEDFELSWVEGDGEGRRQV